MFFVASVVCGGSVFGPCFVMQYLVSFLVAFCFYCLFVSLILFFTSHQQSFSYKGTGLPGLNQY